MSSYNQSQGTHDQYPPAGAAYPVEGKPETQAAFVAPQPPGYPTNDQHHQAAPPAEKTQSRGDGFWRGCCAGLCCCCLLDACF